MFNDPSNTVSLEDRALWDILYTIQMEGSSRWFHLNTKKKSNNFQL